MKKLLTFVKIAIESIDVIAEYLSVVIYAGLALVLFDKLKWTWARRVDSKLTFQALRCLDRQLAARRRILILREELGKDTSEPAGILEQVDSRISNLWKEGCRIYGWKIK